MNEFRDRYEADGFLVVPGVVAAAEVAALNAAAETVCREHGALLKPDGGLVYEDVLCIHFPHKLNATIHAAMSHPGIVAVLTALLGPNVKCMQSMFFVKNAGKPGQAWHQDEYYIPTRDRSLIGGWIALDDATIGNGCLWVLPGSHRPGIIWPTAPHGSDEFDGADAASGFPWPEQDAIPVEVKAGDVVFFNGYLLHRSLRNRSQGFRRALVNHYMRAESLLPWSWDGRLGATQDNRDIVMVAGEDPYAWKGIEENMKPMLRREKKP
jgi:ectoine hydroxylase-related dioxygenase (phytanoyl-CoA dioxygenase family)